MKVVLVRHPQTTWNDKGLFQGSREGKISKLGKLETKKFVALTKNRKIDLIYHAANKRCEYLSIEISKNHAPVKVKKDIRLNERSFGILEGLPERDIASKTNFKPEDFVGKYKWSPEGGESLEKVSIRIKSFFHGLKKTKNQNKTIYIITSGGIIKTALYILGLKNLKEAMSLKIKNLEKVELELT